ncbi:MAG: Unknown protein [uncultured Sulfurovum sp.]|uniref:DUF4178 domain-containing protein n=1 Tax=uncultured Sulfurovum sp. TaxID=269237 RepID=A0A6S6UBY1_9BACT|nr:MAG: Unknown protein [uncultured Sulfurovum sp.]
MSPIKSIKCTNCGAPLNLLGGGRVESITCSYCKSVLDLNDNYKVLTNFKNIREQHKLPFEIGMKGTLKQVEYTIIGRVTYAAMEYPNGEWTDFLLFSPLYGYAYLTYEEGHLIYSKRNRTFPNLTWSQTKNTSPLRVDGKNYQPFDEYEAKVIYVEGELTWIAKRNDKTSFIDLTAPPFGLSVEKTKNEIEYYQAEYLDAHTTYEAFGISKEVTPKSFHALQPFERPFFKSLSLIAYWVLFIIALLFVAVNIDGSGKLITSISADNKAVKQVDFFVNSSKYLVDIELQSAKAKSLNNFNLQIHKNKQIFFALTSTSAYIFNEKNGKVKKKLNPWDKQAKKVLLSLNLEGAGTYHLSIKPIDMTLDSTLFVKIKEERSRLGYIIFFFIFTLILWFIYKFMEWQYQLKVADERGIDLDDDKPTNKNTGFQITMILIVIAMLIIIELNH